MVMGAAVLAPWLVAHCGSDSTTQSGADAAADATANDAPAYEGTVLDVFVQDAPLNGDSDVGDSTVDDGPGTGDASDALEDTFMGIACTPMTNSAGDASDSGEGGQAGALGDSGRDTGEADAAGDAGEGAGDGDTDAGEAGALGSCPGALTCCGGWCTDTNKDPHNCGSCGNACSSSQFCTGLACDDAVVRNVCANARGTVVTDPFSADNAAGGVLGLALTYGCMPGVTVRTTAQDSGIAQDPATGRPLTGPGDTLVGGGGYFGQASVVYMEKNTLVPVVAGTDGTNAWIRNSRTNANVVFTPTTTLTIHHDYFVLEVGVEPVSGTFCLFGYGMLVPGTAAAAFYFQNDVIASRATFPDAWYVYEWTDTDNDGAPSAGDTFTPVGHGK